MINFLKHIAVFMSHLPGVLLLFIELIQRSDISVFRNMVWKACACFFRIVSVRALFFLFFSLTTTCSSPVLFSQIAKAEQQKTGKKQPLAIAYAGRLLGDGQYTRLLIELDRKIDFHSFYINDPPRIVINMDETIFRIKGDNALKPRGLAQKLRYGTMVLGQSRVVISLAGPARVAGAEILRIADDRYQFILDMEKTDINEFRKQIADQRSLAIENKDKTGGKGEDSGSGKKDGYLTIVLDPGHGGIDSGANGSNRMAEKDITLAVAMLLEKKLKISGPFKVYLTRREDRFVSLKERLQFTRRKKADLFISIHADKLEQRSVRGATVYTLSRIASDKLSRRLVESENRVDLVAGLAKDVGSQTVENILIDLASRETKNRSIKFAGYVIEAFRDHIRLIKNPHRHAAFRVLKNMQSPSVLLELGYLSNREDEALLQSAEWREKLTERVVHAVRLFFANRL